MFYIDEIDSKVITDAPPAGTISMGPDTKKLSTAGKKELIKNFWFLMGVTVDENFEQVKGLLAKHGYHVSDKNDAVEAISNLWDTDKWKDFHKDITPVFQKTVEIRFPETKSESSFSPEIIAMIAQAGAQSLSAVSSVFTGRQDIKKAKVEAEGTARAEMLKGLGAVAAQREAAKAEAARAEASKTKALIWVLIALFLIIATVITIIIIKRRKKASA